MTKRKESQGQAPSPDAIFDRPRIIARRGRIDSNHFLLARCAQDCAERILDINRNFERVLILAPEGFADKLAALLPVGKLGQIQTAPQTLDEEALPYNANSFELVISILRLHQLNDLPGVLVQCRAALTSDGLFIGAMFGGQTLTELRQTLYTVDEQINGGMSPRIYPMADFQQAAGLLQRAGFALPVVDTDRLTVSYANPMRLFSDLRDLGESNAMHTRSRKPVSRRFFLSAAQIYLELFSNESGKAKATFEILWLTGWSPHESQQKPLRPGSAKLRLADALGAKEVKL